CTAYTTFLIFPRERTQLAQAQRQKQQEVGNRPQRNQAYAPRPCRLPSRNHRSPVAEVADTGKQEIPASVEQVKGHQQPEEVAPRCALLDWSCSDPEQRSQEEIG